MNQSDFEELHNPEKLKEKYEQLITKNPYSDSKYWPKLVNTDCLFASSRPKQVETEQGIYNNNLQQRVEKQEVVPCRRTKSHISLNSTTYKDCYGKKRPCSVKYLGPRTCTTLGYCTNRWLNKHRNRWLLAYESGRDEEYGKMWIKSTSYPFPHTVMNRGTMKIPRLRQDLTHDKIKHQSEGENVKHLLMNDGNSLRCTYPVLVDAKRNYCAKHKLTDRCCNITTKTEKLPTTDGVSAALNNNNNNYTVTNVKQELDMDKILSDSRRINEKSSKLLEKLSDKEDTGLSIPMVPYENWEKLSAPNRERLITDKWWMTSFPATEYEDKFQNVSTRNKPTTVNNRTYRPTFNQPTGRANDNPHIPTMTEMEY